MNTPSASTLALWTTLVSVSRHLLETIEARLKAEGLPPLAWYDALLEIEKAGNVGIRPFALEQRLLLPQYGTSRLLDRIEKAGLIARAPCEEDGRGHVVRITEEGMATRRRIWPVYARALIELIGNRIGADDATALAEALHALRAPAPPGSEDRIATAAPPEAP
jgi:DNA-binding MarR family transcriptional regulator